MDVARFVSPEAGSLVPIAGVDPRYGEWSHHAFVPARLGSDSPTLAGATYRRIADARAALSALDSTARQLPNPSLLRSTSLRREAQSTSALEGTYEPLRDVLTADDEQPLSVTMREVLNFVAVADTAFEWVGERRPVSVAVLAELQGMLMRGTPSEGPASGSVRDHQVVVGRREDAEARRPPVFAARFVPSPPGDDLRASLDDLLQWMVTDHSVSIDPVAAAGMAHYQFECLHPFHDGNGRLGRLLIVCQLLSSGVLQEPTLTVSPWFEARRAEYYDRLLAVSRDGDWDGWLTFFAEGLAASAVQTREQMLRLVEVQAEMKEVIRQSTLRSDNAHSLVDYAVARPSFTVRQVERTLGVSYGRANRLVSDLLKLGLLETLEAGGTSRRFFAPRVLDVILG